MKLSKIQKIELEGVIVIIFILIIFFLFSWLIPNYVKEKKPIEKVEIEEIVQEPKKYSRINFFISTPARASLAIPEDWEGVYRITESGNSVVFKYIGDQGKEYDIFSISHSQIDKNNKIGDNINEIGQKNGYSYVYMLSTENVDKIKNKTEFLRMSKETEGVIGSFK